MDLSSHGVNATLPSTAVADRVLSVLTLFAGEHADLGVTEISDALHLDKSVVHRILKALVAHEYVVRDPVTRRYSVGRRSWQLGQRYAAVTDLTRIATPPLRVLVTEFECTGYVATLDGMEILYVAVVHTTGPLRVHVEVGNRASAHTTAVGKAMLALLPEDEVLARIGSMPALPTRTPASIGNPAHLLAELREIGETGYALNRGEHLPGVGSVGVGVRSDDGALLAAVSLTFPMLDRFEPLWTELPPRLAQLKRQIADELGIG